MKESTTLYFLSCCSVWKAFAEKEFFTYAFLPRVPNIDKGLGLFANICGFIQLNSKHSATLSCSISWSRISDDMSSIHRCTVLLERGISQSWLATSGPTISSHISPAAGCNNSSPMVFAYLDFAMRSEVR